MRPRPRDRPERRTRAHPRRPGEARGGSAGCLRGDGGLRHGLDEPNAHRRRRAGVRRGGRSRRCGGGGPSGPRRVPRLADRARSGSRSPGEATRPAGREPQVGPGRPDHPRGRKDPFGGSGRGSGDDRRLRPRRGALAAARGSDHAVGASWASAHGDLASRRRRRCHLRLQLPCRGLGVEHDHRARLRRQRRLEAVRAHPPHVACVLGADGDGDPGGGCSQGPPSACPHGPRERRCCSTTAGWP